MRTKEEKIDRARKRLANIKDFKKKVDNMSSCTLVALPFHDMKNGVPTFLPSEDGFCSGLDAAGDWDEGFKEIKEGMVKYVTVHLEWAEESLQRELDEKS